MRQLTKKQKNLDFSGGTFSPDLMAQIIVRWYQEKEENKIDCQRKKNSKSTDCV